MQAVRFVSAPDVVKDGILSLAGGKLDTNDLASWISENQLYKLASSKTPVRVEAHQDYQSMIETFAVAKLSGLPSEFVFLPNSAHDVRRPSEVMESQEGTLDWFKFWSGRSDVQAERRVRWKTLSGSDSLYLKVSQ